MPLASTYFISVFCRTPTVLTGCLNNALLVGDDCVHKSQNLHTDWLLYLCLLFLKLLDLSVSHKQNYHSYQHRFIVIQYGGHVISQPYVQLCHEQICEYLI